MITCWEMTLYPPPPPPLLMACYGPGSSSSSSSSSSDKIARPHTENLNARIRYSYTMTQERLSNIAILSIERDYNIDFNTDIEK